MQSAKPNYNKYVSLGTCHYILEIHTIEIRLGTTLREATGVDGSLSPIVVKQLLKPQHSMGSTQSWSEPA